MPCRETDRRSIVFRNSHILATMNQRRSCTFVFAILGSFLIYPPDPSTTKASKIDQLVSEYQQCGYFNGSILVAEHGKVLYERGVGYADIQTHTPNTPKTKFGIASLSKQFTAALVICVWTLRFRRFCRGIEKTQGRALPSSNFCDTLLAYRMEP